MGSADKMLFIQDGRQDLLQDRQVCGVCLHHRPTRGWQGDSHLHAPPVCGDGANLCHNMGATYLFDDRVRGRGLQAGVGRLVGKAAGYCDVPESQDQPRDRETAHLRQGGSSQRPLGGAKKGQATSMEITATSSSSPSSRPDPTKWTPQRVCRGSWSACTTGHRAERNASRR